MATHNDYPVPANNYMRKPKDESCYEYLQMRYNNFQRILANTRPL